MREQNFSISPELTNYDTNHLNIKRLNEDSRDSLQIDKDPHTQSFDDQNKKLQHKNKLKL